MRAVGSEQRRASRRRIPFGRPRHRLLRGGLLSPRPRRADRPRARPHPGRACARGPRRGDTRPFRDRQALRRARARVGSQPTRRDGPALDRCARGRRARAGRRAADPHVARDASRPDPAQPASRSGVPRGGDRGGRRRRVLGLLHADDRIRRDAVRVLPARLLGGAAVRAARSVDRGARRGGDRRSVHFPRPGAVCRARAGRGDGRALPLPRGARDDRTALRRRPQPAPPRRGAGASASAAARARLARQSSMGEMASAIAHEINQPLTAIANYAYACLRLLRSAPLAPTKCSAGDAAALRREAERAGEMVRKMRSFVRGDEGSLGRGRGQFPGHRGACASPPPRRGRAGSSSPPASSAVTAGARRFDPDPAGAAQSRAQRGRGDRRRRPARARAAGRARGPSPRRTIRRDHGGGHRAWPRAGGRARAACSSRSTPPSPTASGSGSPSAARSSMPTAAGCGQPRWQAAAPRSISCCRSSGGKSGDA